MVDFSFKIDRFGSQLDSKWLILASKSLIWDDLGFKTVDFRFRFGVSLGPIHNWLETLRNRPLPHKEFNCKIKAFILKSFSLNMLRQF